MHFSFPDSVRIENTNHCNAKCVMCPRDLLFRKKGIMSLDLFKRLVDEIAPHPVSNIHLHGFGEPLLDKHLCEKIAYAKEKGIGRTFLITNAALLSEKMAEDLILSGLDSLKVSFYGESKEEYERIQKGLNYERAMSNVRGLIAARDRLGKPNFDIRVQIMADHTDKDFLAHLEKQVGLSSMELHNWAYAEAPKPKAPGTLYSCGKIRDQIMQILWNGDAVPCCLDFDGKVVLGNVFETSITEVWNGKAARGFREAHARQNFPEICKSCDHLRPVRKPSAKALKQQVNGGSGKTDLHAAATNKQKVGADLY